LTYNGEVAGIGDALRGCRTDSNGETVCPDDLGMMPQIGEVYQLTGLVDTLRGCRTDSNGETVCPDDLGMMPQIGEVYQA